MNDHSSRSRSSDVEAITDTSAYRDLIDSLRQRIRESQMHAARALNTELVMLYWSTGREIVIRQQESGWGDAVVARIADDLRVATGGATGFSRRNLFYMRRFATVWPDSERVPSVMAQIPWTAHRLLLDRFADRPTLYEWYATKAAAGHWSVRYLSGQIDLQLYERQGASLTNFEAALPPADAEQALQATKDPYVFDFLKLSDDAKEREPESALMDDIQTLLLELGAGFSFYGRQKALIVGGEEFFVDLIFYHHTLRRFVIIDLKIGKFKPEYVSKMNFYLNAVDEQLCLGDDRESVGIILCTQRSEAATKMALHRVYAPIAVSTWRSAPEALPPVEVVDKVPADLEELAELDAVRERLVEHVTHRAIQIQGGDGQSPPEPSRAERSCPSC